MWTQMRLSEAAAIIGGGMPRRRVDREPETPAGDFDEIWEYTSGHLLAVRVTDHNSIPEWFLWEPEVLP